MPKPKTALTRGTDPLSQFSAMADELGALERDMAPHQQKLARIEQLRKALRAACEVAAAAEWKIEGARVVALLGAKANQSAVDYKKLVKTIGAPAFAKFATCTLGALENNVTPAIAASVVSSDRTGARPLKTFERGAA